jgi:hypothetical protein
MPNQLLIGLELTLRQKFEPQHGSCAGVALK